jgi:hypothetical protein
MNMIKIIALLIVIFFSFSCTEEKRVFMEMNRNIRNGKNYTADEFMEKAQYFLNGRDYYDAYQTIVYRAAPLYQKENNVNGIRKSNGVLCQIYISNKRTCSNKPFL